MIACDVAGCTIKKSGEVSLTAHLIDHGVPPREAQARAQRLASADVTKPPAVAPARACSRCRQSGHYSRSCPKAVTPKPARAAKRIRARRRPPARKPEPLTATLDRARRHLVQERDRLATAIHAIDEALR